MSFISNINNSSSSSSSSKLCAVFILFDKDAEKLLQTIAIELSNKCATVRPYN